MTDPEREKVQAYLDGAPIPMHEVEEILRVEGLHQEEQGEDLFSRIALKILDQLRP
jgi:hypothetical protein